MAERISFDRVADVYDETRGLPPTPLAKAVGVLAEELQGKRVLEIGVGTGRYAVPLQKSGIRVVGVDIAPKMVERGLAKGLRGVVFADGARPLFERHRATSLSARSRQVAKALGYAQIDAGLHERDFPGIVPPSRVTWVARHEESMPADRALGALDRKLFAFLWKVPEDLHEQGMSVLRRGGGGSPGPRGGGPLPPPREDPRLRRADLGQDAHEGVVPEGGGRALAGEVQEVPQGVPRVHVLPALLHYYVCTSA